MYLCYDNRDKLAFFYVEKTKSFGWMKNSKDYYENICSVKIKENDLYFFDFYNNSFELLDRAKSSAVGVNYLSNNKNKKIAAIHWDDVDNCSYFIINKDRNFGSDVYSSLENTSIEEIESKVNYFLLSGSQFSSPSNLREIGYKLPNHRFYIHEGSPSVVASFGGLIDGISSRFPNITFKSVRHEFNIDKVEELSFRSSEFYGHNGLKNAAGNLAVAVSNNNVTYNDICVVPTYSSFFNKYVSLPQKELEGTYFISSKNVSEFFDEPKSITEYLARYLPVKMKPNDKFKEHIGYDIDYVDVKIVSVCDSPILYSFMNHYESISNKKVFITTDDHPAVIDDPDVCIFWFRSNKFYLIDKYTLNTKI